jgi:glycosyltransferase involved in cell wall biosynthesis
MKNVLIITSHFPPQQSAGANRPYSLFKYLPEMGIQVHVVTKRFNNNLANTSFVCYADSYIDWRDSKMLSAKRVKRLVTFLGDRILGIYPDRLWIHQAIEEGGRIMKSHEIDLVYATFPGTESLKIGLELASRYNVPLVAEFRDGLVYESILRNTNFVQRWLAKGLEKKVVKQSKAVVSVAKAITDYFKQKYHLDDVYTVFNGYDEDDFTLTKGVTAIPNPHGQRIYHFGNLNTSRSTNREHLFEALAYLKKQGEIDASWFAVVFVGQFTANEEYLITKHQVADIVTFIGHMPKQKGIQQIMQDGTGLLFYGVRDESSIVSSKLPEYLRIGKPILGICKGNEAAGIIERTGTGLVSGFDTPDIIAMFRDFIQGAYLFSPNQEEISLFNRKNQANQIAAIIANVLTKNG